MSVCFSLSKINSDVFYKGYYLDFLSDNSLDSLEKLEASLGAPMTSDGHWPSFGDDEELYTSYDNWCKEQEMSAWSDGKLHDKINLTHYHSYLKLNKCRCKSRFLKRLESLPVKTFNNGHYIERYIPVDEMIYRQGWCLKKSFFRKEFTCVICVTKKQMINFFNQYLDFSDPCGREIYDTFVNSWEDGMVFDCSW